MILFEGEIEWKDNMISRQNNSGFIHEMEWESKWLALLQQPRRTSSSRKRWGIKAVCVELNHIGCTSSSCKREAIGTEIFPFCKERGRAIIFPVDPSQPRQRRRAPVAPLTRCRLVGALLRVMEVELLCSAGVTEMNRRRGGSTRKSINCMRQNLNYDFL